MQQFSSISYLLLSILTITVSADKTTENLSTTTITPIFNATEKWIPDAPTAVCSPEGISITMSQVNMTLRLLMSPSKSNASDHCTITFEPMQNIEQFFNFTKCPPTPSTSKRALASLLIVSRHSQFVTLNDTAYLIECQFTDGAVQAQLTVKPENFEHPAILESNASLPNCEYNVNIGGTYSHPSSVAPSVSIGQSVVHNWQCTDASSLIFCMRVYNCSVNDGVRDLNIPLVNQNGCVVKSRLELFSPITYSASSASLRAYASSRIVSFGSSQLIYRCSIRLSIKAPSNKCPAIDCVDGDVSDSDSDSSGWEYTEEPQLLAKPDNKRTLDFTLSTNLTMPEDGKKAI